MAVTKVGYINKFLNNMASASPTASVEALTGLPIATGLQINQYQNFGDGEAASYSSKKLVSVQILTAGSGQTPGTYSVTASAGGAVISVVVAGGGTVTAVPTITTPGFYATDTVPTFTLAAGGTPATFSATVGYLYSGTYGFCQLDPAVVTATIPIGTPLYWLATSSNFVVTTVATGNYPDLAGFSIDPAFGAALPYAFIQMTGKVKALFSATAATTLGNVVNLDASPGATVNGTGTTAVTNLTVGIALQLGTTLSPALVRLTRGQSRF